MARADAEINVSQARQRVEKCRYSGKDWEEAIDLLIIAEHQLAAVDEDQRCFLAETKDVPARPV